MDLNELLNLRARLWSAKVNKHTVGGAAGYAAALEKAAGPVDFRGRKHSTDHLLALVEKAIQVSKAPEKPKVAAKPAPAPKPAPDAPKSAPTPKTVAKTERN